MSNAEEIIKIAEKILASECKIPYKIQEALSEIIIKAREMED